MRAIWVWYFATALAASVSVTLAKSPAAAKIEYFSEQGRYILAVDPTKHGFAAREVRGDILESVSADKFENGPSAIVVSWYRSQDDLRVEFEESKRVRIAEATGTMIGSTADPVLSRMVEAPVDGTTSVDGVGALTTRFSVRHDLNPGELILSYRMVVLMKGGKRYVIELRTPTKVSRPDASDAAAAREVEREERKAVTLFEKVVTGFQFLGF